MLKPSTGTYFSLPEWYNPAYKRYAYAPGGGFPGGKYAFASMQSTSSSLLPENKTNTIPGPPTNPYTGKVLDYTGYVPVNDFIQHI